MSSSLNSILVACSGASSTRLWLFAGLDSRSRRSSGYRLSLGYFAFEAALKTNAAFGLANAGIGWHVSQIATVYNSSVSAAPETVMTKLHSGHRVAAMLAGPFALIAACVAGARADEPFPAHRV